MKNVEEHFDAIDAENNEEAYNILTHCYKELVRKGFPYDDINKEEITILMGDNVSENPDSISETFEVLHRKHKF